MRAASSRSRLAPSIASSRARSRASTAAVSGGNTKRFRMKKRMPKMTRVQIISPAFGARMLTLSSASCAAATEAADTSSVRARSSVMRMGKPGQATRNRKGRRGPRGPRPRRALRELALNEECDHDSDQRGALDERGQDQRARLDRASRLGLARHSLDSPTADQADAEAGADHGESGADASAEERPSAHVLAGERRGGLQKREDTHYELQSVRGGATSLRGRPRWRAQRAGRLHPPPVGGTRVPTGIPGRSAGYVSSRVEREPAS